jgi:hypothetical protein
MGGASQESAGSQQGGLDLGSLLQGLMGGGGQQAGGQGGLDMGSLMQGMLGGGEQQAGGQGGLDMGSLMQGMLGGGQQQASSQGGPDVGSLMQGMLGSSNLGVAGSQGSGAGSFLAPILEPLAEKLGLPPQIAQAVIGFVLAKLMSGQPSGSGRAGLVGGPGQNADLTSLLSQAGSIGGVAQGDVEATGLHQELAQMTGMDSETASRSLATVINLMGGQSANAEAALAPARRKPAGKASRGTTRKRKAS